MMYEKIYKLDPPGIPETNEGQNFGPWNWSARHGQRRGHGKF